jgi:D-arabinose 1-dehydrogenase-like Zn-dependent alcohol dehydrogenase
MRSTKGYAALGPTSPLAPFTFDRRDIGESDIGFEIAYAGICHSDIHQVREEWGPALYPMVPGHEIVGIVTEVGASVTKFRVGDRIGVGVFIDSCRNCTNCNLAGSMIGGMPELQEMLDFCGERSLLSDVEMISADYINNAYERAVASDVKYRFVIDAKTF